MKFLYFLMMIATGITMMKYCRWIVINFDFRSATAERFFGDGGTYTFVKLFGAGLCIFSFYYLVRM